MPSRSKVMVRASVLDRFRAEDGLELGFKGFRGLGFRVSRSRFRAY